MSLPLPSRDGLSEVWNWVASQHRPTSESQKQVFIEILDLFRKNEEERIRKLSDKNDKEQSCVAQLRAFYHHTLTDFHVPASESCWIILKNTSLETKNWHCHSIDWMPTVGAKPSESSDRTIGPNGIQHIGLTTKSPRHCDFSVIQSFAILCLWYLQGCGPWTLQVTLELLHALGEASKSGSKF